MRFGSFDEMLRHYAAQSPDAPALYHDGGARPRVCTYAALESAVEARAEALRASGKTCIGVLADGGFACVVTIFAAVRAGLQVVLLDENLPDALLRVLLPYTDIDTLWGDPELCEELTPYLSGGVTDGAHRLLFFTSGTTDSAKAVVLTDRSLMASAYNGGALLPLSPGDTLLCMLPLGHVFGFVCGLLWGLSCGAAVALGRGPRHYADDCAYFRPTAVSVVPLLLGFLQKYRALNPELKLVLVGAGDCPPALLESVKATGRRVSFGYGLTETSSGVALSLGSDPYAMTVCPDDTVTVADDGELLLCCPTCVMQGYYKRDADTADVLRGGVLYTGDLGRFDENGLLHITGRKKEVIVLPDGTKLYLPEYERELSAALGAEELCVILRSGAPVLVLGKSNGGDARKILARLTPVLADRPRGQQIKDVLFFPAALPRTATGKIRRWELQKALEEQL